MTELGALYVFVQFLPSFKYKRLIYLFQKNNGLYNSKSKKECNDQESIEPSTTPDPGHHIGK